MARHRTFASLASALRRHAKQVDSSVGVHVRRAALIADSSVVFGTPVDLGRARSSWSASIGAAQPSDTGVTEEIGGDLAAGIAIAQAKGIIGTWKPDHGSIFLNNSVEYITSLDRGSSAQAPQGMTTQAIEAARSSLRGAKLLKVQS